jgi:hypothetical protein
MKAACILEMTNVKHERQRPFGKPRQNVENNAKMGLIDGVKL